MEENTYPIVIVSGPDGKAIAEAFFHKDSISLGRGEENDICVLDEEMKISREHIRLVKKDASIYLYDLKSRNGTLLNGNKIESEPACVKLSPNDEVRIGDYTLRVYSSVSPSSDQPKDQKEITSADTLEHEIEASAYPLQQLSSSSIQRREKLSALSLNVHEQGPVVHAATPWLNMPKVVLLIAIVFGVGWHFGWWSKESQPRNQDPASHSTLLEVKTIKVQMKSKEEPVLLQASGYITVRRQASINALSDGEIEHITAKVGDKVKGGQILAQLSQSNAKVELARCKSEMNMNQFHCDEIARKRDEAARVLERKKEMYRRRLVSKSEFDAAQAELDDLTTKVSRYRENIEQSRQEWEKAKISLENTFIRAPFEGVLLEKLCEVGEFVYKQGKPVFTLIDRTGIGASVDINETYIPKIFVGQKIELVLNAYPSYRYEGKIRKILPAVDKQKATVPVDIVFLDPNELILPGMTVRATFFEKKHDASVNIPKILLPEKAVYQEKDRHFVWICTPGSKVEKRKVIPGKTFEDQVEIIQGLVEEDEVVVSSAGDLKEGMKVKTRN